MIFRKTQTPMDAIPGNIHPISYLKRVVYNIFQILEYFSICNVRVEILFYVVPTMDESQWTYSGTAAR